MNEPTMPLVSIGMPCYNVSADVERAIRSIQDGLYSNWELVCVDDGSTDSTPEILNRIASCDERVKVYRQHNGVSPKLVIRVLSMHMENIWHGLILMIRSSRNF